MKSPPTPRAGEGLAPYRLTDGTKKLEVKAEDTLLRNNVRQQAIAI